MSFFLVLFLVVFFLCVLFVDFFLLFCLSLVFFLGKMHIVRLEDDMRP